MTIDLSNSEQSNTELLKSQGHTWNNPSNLFISFISLKSAIELGIPDIINNHGGPMTHSKLIKALPHVNKSKSHFISRLMRILVHSDFFVKEKIKPERAEAEAEEDADAEGEGYSLTPVMMKMEGMLDPVVLSAWLHMGEWFRDDHSTPFETAHRMTFWDYMGQNPKFNDLFNKSMANRSQDVAKVIIRDCQGAFAGLNSVVDVGGGTGTLAKAIANAFPHINCINFDLPHVVAGLEGTKNLTHVEGDMFLAIRRANAIILKWILHDWSDEECVKILKRCKEAIPCREKGGKLMIIDMVMEMEKNDDNNKSNETHIISDMRMMILTKGRERNEKEWAKLFLEAGFSDYKISPPLDLKSMIEPYPLIEVYP